MATNRWHRINVYFTEDEAAGARAFAPRLGRSSSWFIRQAVRFALENRSLFLGYVSRNTTEHALDDSKPEVRNGEAPASSDAVLARSR